MSDQTPQESLGTILRVVEKRDPEFVSLVENMLNISLTASQRSVIVQKLRKILRDDKTVVSDEKGEDAISSEAMEYIWTYRPLPDADMRVLLDAVSLYAPSTASITNKIGVRSLAAEEREELRQTLVKHLLINGFGENYKPNALGKQIEAIIDYLGHV